MGKKRQTTEEVVRELQDFHHYTAAAQLERLNELAKHVGLCVHCGRIKDCERMK